MNPRSDKYAPKFSDKTWLQRALSDKAVSYSSQLTSSAS